jgi:cell division protease FtsH
MLNPHADPVRKVSIIPRGSALGVTFASPDADRFSHDEEYLRAKIQVALGGRVAEEMVFGNVTTGAESDIAQLTEVARAMAGRWGMSPAIGPLLVMPDRTHAPLFAPADPPSEATRQTLDSEARRLVLESMDAVRALLAGHRAQLDALAGALMDHETLDELEAYAAGGIPGTHNGRLDTATREGRG